MEYRVLGPIEVLNEGRPLRLGGPKQRALLAMLLLRANEAVSRDRLIDGMWGDRPPPSAAHSLDGYVSRLRAALGADRVRRRAPGYLLSIDPGEMDLDRFEALVARARDAKVGGDPRGAALLLGSALDLWRGPALADLLFEPFAAVEAPRLEERRLAVQESWIEARLEAGDGPELVLPIEDLLEANPFRERLVAQLMLALYRAGRQAESLDHLQAARRRLAGELGLDVGRELRELERRILQRDPGLGFPARAAVSRRRGLGRVAGGAAVLAAAAVATAGILLAVQGTKPARPARESSRLVAIAPGSGTLVQAAELRGPPASMRRAAGSLWVADPNNQVLERFDSSGAVVDRIPIGGEPGGVAQGGGAIWVTSTLGGAIHRIDPTTDTVTQTVPLAGATASGIAFADGGLWVADAADHALIEISASSGSVVRTFTLDLGPAALAPGGGRAMWVAGYDEGSVEEIDLRSGEPIATVRVGNGPSAVAAGPAGVWVTNSLDSTVSRIDPRHGAVVATIPVGSDPVALTVASGAVWVASAFSEDVSVIDPRSNRLRRRIRVGGSPQAIEAVAGRIWVATAALGRTHRGGTLTLTSSALFPSIDPASNDFVGTLQFGSLVYDTLVTFERAGGPDGLRLVPDLALELPQPTDGGTTYAFRLRPGIRYSDGRRLAASDARRAIERLFAVGSRGVDLFTGIVGARGCSRHPTRCDLSRGIVTDDLAGAVVFHLDEPDPDFLYKLTVFSFSAPVPIGTTRHDAGFTPVPGTGPYRVLKANSNEIVLVRNRFFRERSHAAQPAGNPDRIVWRFASTPEAALRAVERGSADWVFDLLPGRQLEALRLRFPGRLHADPSFDVDWIALNTRRPPFDDVRVRRALNYAVDRAKIVRMYGGLSTAAPICQPLARGMPGYRPYCPYTRNPSRAGRWTAPDLRRARRLVDASGTKGMRVDVWGASGLLIPREVPTYVATVLRSLGYRTRLHVIPYSSYTPALRRSLQLTVDGDWVADYPAPSSYLPSFFACTGGHNRKQYVCDPDLDRQMGRAAVAAFANPVRAAAIWAEIDHALVDRALWVPTVSVRNNEFVSRRLRNYQFNPVGGFIADQVWLR